MNENGMDEIIRRTEREGGGGNRLHVLYMYREEDVVMMAIIKYGVTAISKKIQEKIATVTISIAFANSLCKIVKFLRINDVENPAVALIKVTKNTAGSNMNPNGASEYQGESLLLVVMDSTMLHKNPNE